jgi:hypothetical protein
MEHQLMRAQTRVHDLDVDEILAQPVREIDNKLLPISPMVVGVFEQR